MTWTYLENIRRINMHYKILLTLEVLGICRPKYRKNRLCRYNLHFQACVYTQVIVGKRAEGLHFKCLSCCNDTVLCNQLSKCVTSPKSGMSYKVKKTYTDIGMKVCQLMLSFRFIISS